MNRRRLLAGALGVAAGGALLLPGYGTRRRVERIKPIIEPPPYHFPRNFLWGTATAAAQIERRVPSDWGRFEERVERDQLTRSEGPGRVVPGNIAGYLDYPPSIRDRKANAEDNYDEDFTAAVAQGHNAYRFSLSWSRLFPRVDSKTPNPEAVATYDSLFAALESAGLDPMVTLFHFESPAWLWEEKEGQRGWEREDAVDHFDHFVKFVVERWGRKVRRWTTLNEPMVYVYNGYLQGLFPPFERRSGPEALGKVLENLLRAHVRAYKRIHGAAREHGVRQEVGVAAHTRSFLPYRDRAPLDRVVAEQVEQAFIWDFLDAMDTGHLRLTNTKIHCFIPDLAHSQDYVGINYYGRYYLKSDLFHPTDFQLLVSDPADPLEQISDLGWAIDPQGLHQILVRASRAYQRPIYVTENGLADATDSRRSAFIVQHVRAMWDAIQDGVDVRGYYHWSLFDNFEWAEGFAARFGLWEVDYTDNFRRIPRPSAVVYSEICRENGISAGLWEKYGRWEVGG